MAAFTVGRRVLVNPADLRPGWERHGQTRECPMQAPRLLRPAAKGRRMALDGAAGRPARPERAKGGANAAKPDRAPPVVSGGSVRPHARGTWGRPRTRTSPPTGSGP